LSLVSRRRGARAPVGTVSRGAPAIDTASRGAVPAGPGDRPLRPLLVTFGSVTAPDGGVQVRSRLIAEILTDMGAPPVVVSTREPEGAAPVHGWATRIRVPERKPYKAFSPSFARLIREESAQATVLIVTNAMFLPAVAWSRSRLPLIWDTNECQTLHYRRLPPSLVNRTKYAAWTILERWAAHRCQVAVAIGDTEARAWRTINPALFDKIAVIDHAAFFAEPVSEPRGELGRLTGRALDGPVLLFLGTLRAKHNAAAASWILDTLVDTLPPTVTVVLCGPGTERLSRPDSTGAGVVALGPVVDVDTVVAAADLCLAPLATGAGVKTKVLHYLAHGKPVAGTPAAFEGLSGAPGLHTAPLDDLPVLIGELCRQVEDPVAADDRARSQRSWLEQHHGRDHIRSQWEDVIGRLRGEENPASPTPRRR